jgi:hypothetical protein
MPRIEIIVNKAAFKEAEWQLECENIRGQGRREAIWCPDSEQDCGLAAVDDNGCLRCFFTGPNVDVAEAVAFFQSCLLKGDDMNSQLTPKQLAAVQEHMAGRSMWPWTVETITGWFIEEKVFDQPEEHWQEAMYEITSWEFAKIEMDRELSWIPV